MKKYFEILKKCPLFFDIEDNELEAMLHCLGARVVSFDKKYTVIAEGTPAKYIAVLLSGAAQIFQIDYYGNRSLIDEISPSEMFAEAFACAENGSVPITVTASEPSEVMLIDSSHLLHTCANNCSFHRKLIFDLMKNLAAKTIRLHRRAELLSKRSTREKLMSYLMSVAKEKGRSEFEIPFDRQELADYLCVDRSGLSAEIAKLRKEGVLFCRKNRFKLL
ncbi:MAG: Crp/Fnr family transcriptional regulator [Clostridia bacterium]|nr:Crp/Fnr family transcriptional regulator [Clostridia bacterium]